MSGLNISVRPHPRDGAAACTTKVACRPSHQTKKLRGQSDSARLTSSWTSSGTASYTMELHRTRTWTSSGTAIYTMALHRARWCSSRPLFRQQMCTCAWSSRTLKASRYAFMPKMRTLCMPAILATVNTITTARFRPRGCRRKSEP